jgi:peroxiredoxin Q/BCP
VAYFAASTDDSDTNRKFAAKLELTYPVLSDASRDTARAYGVVGLLPWASRWTFYIGKDGRILRIDKDVNVSSAGADIVRHLEDLGVARK